MNTSNTSPHTCQQHQRPSPQFAHPAAFCGMPARPLYLASQEPAALCGMPARSLHSHTPSHTREIGRGVRKTCGKLRHAWASAFSRIAKPCGILRYARKTAILPSLWGGARGEVQQTKTLWHTAACPADCSSVSRSPTAALSHPSPGGRGAGGDVRETCDILGHARSPASRPPSLNHPLCAYHLSAAYDVEHHIAE